ncbi:MAG: MiaB/RimO family radical SAM methylthiotransferase [Actinomycetes bacterium]
MSPRARTAHIATLGCARNTVDSDELAGRLEDGGWAVADDPDHADVTVVNTCGFVESAKRESIDELLAAAGDGRRVVAVGCLAERYGSGLADALPEVSAVLSFDDYDAIAERLTDVVEGRPLVARDPVDRRTLLPLAPTARPAAAVDVGIPGHLGGPQGRRRRLDTGPVAPVKLASGCDRRCSFCAIPSFRGAFVSRSPDEILAEVHWLADDGVREVELVSENTTSYGKDVGDLRLLDKLLPRIAAVPGIQRVRLAYLQPAELRPSLVAAIATTPGVAAYFDLSLQHASGAVLRRMRRYGDAAHFVTMLESVRALAPDAGIRTNVIVGFPGETDDDLAVLHDFLVVARLDAVGVFGYSDEDGTEAASFADKVADDVVRDRVERTASLVDELVAQRALDRLGEQVHVLVESVDDDGVQGRAAHQGADDGNTCLVGFSGDDRPAVGDLVSAVVVDTDGVDLIAEPVAARS